MFIIIIYSDQKLINQHTPRDAVHVYDGVRRSRNTFTVHDNSGDDCHV